MSGTLFLKVRVVLLLYNALPERGPRQVSRLGRWPDLQSFFKVD